MASMMSPATVPSTVGKPAWFSHLYAQVALSGQQQGSHFNLWAMPS
jgi:hypothetical protein